MPPEVRGADEHTRHALDCGDLGEVAERLLGLDLHDQAKVILCQSKIVPVPPISRGARAARDPARAFGRVEAG